MKGAYRRENKSRSKTTIRIQKGPGKKDRQGIWHIIRKRGIMKMG
jgi:hypothetical protein